VALANFIAEQQIPNSINNEDGFWRRRFFIFMDIGSWGRGGVTKQ
jgi:hypothetical protein